MIDDTYSGHLTHLRRLNFKALELVSLPCLVYSDIEINGIKISVRDLNSNLIRRENELDLTTFGKKLNFDDIVSILCFQIYFLIFS